MCGADGCEAGEDCYSCPADCAPPTAYASCDNGGAGECYRTGNLDSCGLNCDAPAAAGLGSGEVCDGLDNDCDGLVDAADPSLAAAPLLDRQDGICSGYTKTCSGGGWVDDYTVVPGYQDPETAAFCNAVDDDCDGDIDEGLGYCYDNNFAIPRCTGSITCDDSMLPGCLNGCTLEPGRCSDTRYLCVNDGDCPTGTCEDEHCTGVTTCGQFTDWVECTGYGSCSWDSCDSFSTEQTGCEATAGCNWQCGSLDDEVCGNNIDDDGDTKIDCQDEDCQVTSLMSLNDEQMERYNCLGSSQLGNVTRNWYCGIAKSDSSVGLCCEDGNRPNFVLGSWRCTGTNPCDPAIVGSKCGYYYDTQFSNWINEVGVSTDANWCVSPTEQRACCSVVHFASLEYWDDEDSGNVVIY